MLLWIYWIDEDEQLHRIPMARYTRIFNRTEPIKLFAGKSIRLIEAHVQIDELMSADEHLSLDGSACVNRQDAFFSGSAYFLS